MRKIAIAGGLLLIFVCLVLFFVSYNQNRINEEGAILPENNIESSGPTTSERGAIEQARDSIQKEMEAEQFLHENAESVGLTIGILKYQYQAELLRRILTNDTLRSAFLFAKENEIRVMASEGDILSLCRVLPSGTIFIDTRATDEKIVAFLLENTPC